MSCLLELRSLPSEVGRGLNSFGNPCFGGEGALMHKLLRCSSAEGGLVTLFLFPDEEFAPGLGLPDEGSGSAHCWCYHG